MSCKYILSTQRHTTEKRLDEKHHVFMALPPWSLHCSSVALQLDEVAMRSAAIEAWFHHLPNLGPGGRFTSELGAPRAPSHGNCRQLRLNVRAIKTWTTSSATWCIISRCSQGAMILVAAHVLNTNRGCDLCRSCRIGWIWKWTSVCRLWLSSVPLGQSEDWNLKQAGKLAEILPPFSPRCKFNLADFLCESTDFENGLF